MTRDADPGNIPFTNILNFRDVGAHINHLTGQTLLKPGRLYRSARPDSATPEDQHKLTSTLHIRTVVDLRTPTEHLEAQQKAQSTTRPPHPPHDPQRPLRIPNLNYHEVNLNGKPYTTALLAHLTWPQTLHLYALYALGYRTQAIAILARNVMAPRGLAGLAIDTLTHSATTIGTELFAPKVLAHEAAYPVLVHCTQGKDRTGLVVLLLLLLCGVPETAIEADYAASGPGLAAEREAKVREVQAVGFPAAFADVEEGWVRKVVGWIGEQGGVEAYLEREAGVGREVQEEIRRILMA